MFVLKPVQARVLARWQCKWDYPRHRLRHGLRHYLRRCRCRHLRHGAPAAVTCVGASLSTSVSASVDGRQEVLGAVFQYPGRVAASTIREQQNRGRVTD